MALLPRRVTWYCSNTKSRLLERHGLGRLQDVLAAEPAEVSKHRHKDVRRVLLTDGGVSRVVYVKRQWEWERPLPRWADVRDGVAGRPDPVRECRGLRRMAAIGFDVPGPWVLFRDRRPLSPRAAIIIPAIPAASSLAELVSRGWPECLEHEERLRLAESVASVAHRLESARLRWRSMKARHFYPEQTADGDWRLWLIDCEGVRVRASQRQHRRDREVLLRSLEKAGASVSFVGLVVAALTKPRGASSRCRRESTLSGSAASAA